MIVSGIASVPGSEMMMTCSRSVSRSRIDAIFRRYSLSVVTRTLPWPSVIRVSMGSGPNAENSGANTLPFLSVPSAAM